MANLYSCFGLVNAQSPCTHLVVSVFCHLIRNSIIHNASYSREVLYLVEEFVDFISPSQLFPTEYVHLQPYHRFDQHDSFEHR